VSSRFFFDPTNLLILPATIIGAIRHADWRGAREREGVPGVADEMVHAALGTNTMAFFIPTSSHWQIQDVQALLLRHGVKLWGVGYWNGEMYFRVKKRQSHWAQYVMLRAGVPLLHGLMPGSRAIPGAGGQIAPPREARASLLSWVANLLE
jgi:hypothetical protein